MAIGGAGSLTCGVIGEGWEVRCEDQMWPHGISNGVNATSVILWCSRLLSCAITLLCSRLLFVHSADLFWQDAKELIN